MMLKRGLLLISVLFLLSGCGQPQEDNVCQISDGASCGQADLFENVDLNSGEEKGTVSLPEDEQNGSGETLEETEKRYLEKQKNYEYVAYDAANRVRGADKDKDRQSLFCIDQETGVVYFVNRDKDWYIYRMYDDTTVELAVKIPARQLFMLHGTLYFIVEGYDMYEFDDVTEGDIYAYTPADGSVKKIFSADGLEGEIYRMLPYEDGIAFECLVYLNEDGTKQSELTAGSSGMAQWSWYYYTFADERLEKDPYRRSYPGWENYYLQPTVINGNWKISLKSRDTAVQDTRFFEGVVGFIIGDTLYTADSCSVYASNLLTGAQKEYDCRAMYEAVVTENPVIVYRGENSVLVTCFTVTRDYIWVVIGDVYLLRIDPVTEEAICYFFVENESTKDDLDMLDRILRLYTDGINLYAFYSHMGYKNGGHEALVRVNTEEVIGQHWYRKVPILKVDYVTE